MYLPKAAIGTRRAFRKYSERKVRTLTASMRLPMKHAGVSVVIAVPSRHWDQESWTSHVLLNPVPEPRKERDQEENSDGSLPEHDGKPHKLPEVEVPGEIVRVVVVVRPAMLFLFTLVINSHALRESLRWSGRFLRRLTLVKPVTRHSLLNTSRLAMSHIMVRLVSVKLREFGVALGSLNLGGLNANGETGDILWVHDSVGTLNAPAELLRQERQGLVQGDPRDQAVSLLLE